MRQAAPNSKKYQGKKNNHQEYQDIMYYRNHRKEERAEKNN